jgi:thiamine-monophosphate kinase
VTQASTPGESAEDRLIGRFFRPLATHPGALGLRDDAAVLTPPPGCDIVLKTDPIIAGVHFFADDPAETVARKALRVNLSDLAAKGAKPVGFLLALALPEGVQDEWLAAFARALGADADYYQCPLLGGDTDRTPGPLSVSIAAFGTVAHAGMVRRSGAKAGDRIIVSGTIGDAALGLKLRRAAQPSRCWVGLTDSERQHLLARYLVPEPRTGLAAGLSAHASAAMDISDGLAGDLAKLCRASAVSAEVDVTKIPLSQGVRSVLRADPRLITSVLTGGDDYEILCTLDNAQLEAFFAAAKSAGVAVSAIGDIVAGTEPPRFRDQSGEVLVFRRPSYSHF